jgi:hypothetical protein
MLPCGTRNLFHLGAVINFDRSVFGPSLLRPPDALGSKLPVPPHPHIFNLVFNQHFAIQLNAKPTAYLNIKSQIGEKVNYKL